MKTKVKNKIIDFSIAFDSSTSEREETIDFAEGLISGKEWVNKMYDKEAVSSAKLMISNLGIKKTRSRLRRWIKKDFW